jgi:muconolactone delta-isomerase
MGSFNIKCFASNQVIAEGEACRVVVIIQKASFHPMTAELHGKKTAQLGVSNRCGATDAWWSPVTAFMSGHYADYSKVELDDTPENQTILTEFYNSLYRTGATVVDDEKQTTVFDFPALVQKHAPQLHAKLTVQTSFYDRIRPEELDMEEAMVLWDVLQDAIISGQAYKANSLQVVRPVKLAVLHEASFQQLVKTVEATNSYRGKSYAREAYFGDAFANLASDLADVEEEMKRFVRKDHFREVLRFDADSLVMHPTTWAFRVTFDDAIEAVVERKQPVSHFLATCAYALDSLYATFALEQLNIQYSPITYAGQDYSNEVGKQYADFVAEVSATVCAGRKAWMEE